MSWLKSTDPLKGLINTALVSRLFVSPLASDGLGHQAHGVVAQVENERITLASSAGFKDTPAVLSITDELAEAWAVRAYEKLIGEIKETGKVGVIDLAVVVGATPFIGTLTEQQPDPDALDADSILLDAEATAAGTSGATSWGQLQALYDELGTPGGPGAIALRRLQAQYDELSALHTDLIQSNAALQQEHEALAQSHRELQAAHDATGATLVETAEELRATREVVAHARQEVHEKDQKIAEVEADRDRVTALYGETVAQAKQAAADCIARDQEIETLKARIAELEAAADSVDTDKPNGSDVPSVRGGKKAAS